MGAGVSEWRLAHSVSSLGQIGVVSGTALDLILARRLQLGDPGGHMRRALKAFPDQDIADRILNRYFIPDGKVSDQPFISKPMVGHKSRQVTNELLVASNFVEVFLAKEGHDGLVGINFLHKIQAPLLPSIYGAMLADVDIVIVGAGIPLEIPEVIDGLCRSELVEVNLPVQETERGETYKLSFNPKDVFGDSCPSVKRPLFFPIVSSVVLASILIKKCDGKVDGLIIEGPSAGGHNAPPRGQATLSPKGEPVYGPRDEVDLEAIKALGLPFWLAGSYGSPEKLAHACAAGAEGIQVGTLFAFSDESGLRKDVKRDTIERCKIGKPDVFKDPIASPTGFPFQVLSISGTLSDVDVYEERPRKCDLGYLREAYKLPNGSIGWRCSSEERDLYLNKGGDIEETVGRKCLCNALMANIGLAQVRKDKREELPLVTCGDDLSGIIQVLDPAKTSYSASEVIDFLLAKNKS
jgi:nitronate monooxygenase